MSKIIRGSLEGLFAVSVFASVLVGGLALVGFVSLPFAVIVMPVLASVVTIIGFYLPEFIREFKIEYVINYTDNQVNAVREQKRK